MNIYDIAKKADCSITTISRVLNNSNLVNTKTKTKILSLIKKTNYYPDFFYKSLAKGKTNLIGVYVFFTDYYETYYFKEIFHGIMDAVSLNDKYNVVVYSPKLNNNGLPKILSGFVLIGADAVSDPIILQNLKKIKEPTVSINNKIKGFNYIDTNNLVSAYNVVKYLIELGHKNIGFINVKNHENIRERYMGYRKALLENNINSNCIINLDGSTEIKAYDAVSKWINSNKNKLPTVFFAATDRIAIGAMKALKEKGLKIPEEISIVGFDDIDMSRFIEPNLTTVHQPLYEMGKKAVEILIKQMEGRQIKLQQIIMPTNLVKRDSCRKIN